MENILQVKLLSPTAILPTKAHDTDLGYDLYADESGVITHRGIIKTGIAVKFPKGYGALIRDRSSVSTKQWAFVVAGVIDENYTGEIKIAYGLIPPYTDFVYNTGDKIAQMILIPTVNFPVQLVNELPITDRAAKGFGSSGI